MPEPRQIEQIAQKEAELFKSEQAARFLECAINLCAESMPMSAVVKLLEDHAEIIRMYE